MIWRNCFWGSIVFFVFFIITSFSINNSKIANRFKLKMLNGFAIGVGCASAIMFYPINLALISGNSVWDWTLAGIQSCLNTMQIFAVRFDATLIERGLVYCPENYQIFYKMLANSLSCLAPIATVSFAISVFRNSSARFQYWRCFFKEEYIFSELNKKSLTLASDIRKNNKKALIVFAGVSDDNLIAEDLIHGAGNLQSICFGTDIVSLKCDKHVRRKKVSFILLSEDEDKNLVQGLKLIKKYQKKAKRKAETHIYVFSNKIECDPILSSIERGEKLKVRRINEVRSLINHILYDEGQRLFETAVEGEDRIKKISAVIIGMGRHGMEMLKALSWFGQMDGYFIEIDVFDKDSLAEKKLIAQSPDLISDKYNNLRKPGEAQYKINIHSGIDIGTEEFVKEIYNIKKATYVFVALGKDEDNIQTAMNLRSQFTRMGISPIIQSVVYDSQKKRALQGTLFQDDEKSKRKQVVQGLCNFKKQPYNIEFIGDIESSYRLASIRPSKLEEKALDIHFSFNGKKRGETDKTDEHLISESFWAYEYNYRSSIACAIHGKARIYCDIPGAGKEDADLDENEREIIGSLEHRRWNAYMRADGYTIGEKKDYLGKTHPQLCEYHLLKK